MRRAWLVPYNQKLGLMIMGDTDNHKSVILAALPLPEVQDQRVAAAIMVVLIAEGFSIEPS